MLERLVGCVGRVGFWLVGCVGRVGRMCQEGVLRRVREGWAERVCKRGLG